MNKHSLLGIKLLSISAICIFGVSEVLNQRKAEALELQLGKNFSGTSRELTGQTAVDTMGSVSENFIVELNNNEYRVYDKTAFGGRPNSPLLPIQQSSLEDFWINIGTPIDGPIDSRLVYDPTTQRWFASTLDVPTNSIFLAVSNDEDPTNGWRWFDIYKGSTLPDYPTLGIDANGVYLSANELSISNHPIIAISKEGLLSPTLSSGSNLVSEGIATIFPSESRSTVGWTLQPAIDFGPPDNTAALLATESRSSGDELVRTDILNVETGSATKTTTRITVNSYTKAPDADQPDNPPAPTDPLSRGSFQNPGGAKANLDNTAGERFSSSIVEVGNSLWAAQNVDMGGRAAIRWYEIDETSNKILQEGTIIGDTDGDGIAELDLIYPSIATNKSGNVVIGFTGSGADQFASSYAVLGETTIDLTGSRNTQFGDLVLLAEGKTTYESGSSRNRWGDYSETVIDPSNPLVFWTFQEKADNPLFIKTLPDGTFDVFDTRTECESVYGINQCFQSEQWSTQVTELVAKSNPDDLPSLMTDVQRMATETGFESVPGSVNLLVDAFGAFGRGIFNNLDDVPSEQQGSFDAFDAMLAVPDDSEFGAKAAGTTFESGLAIGFGNVRTFLTKGDIGGSKGGEEESFISGGATFADSVFQFNDLTFDLEQTLKPIFSGSGNLRLGSQLEQTYTITNTSEDTVSFDLIRYFDGDFLIDQNFLNDGGGRIQENGLETLFVTNQVEEDMSLSPLVGINAQGGILPTNGRFEIDHAWDLLETIISGDNLDNTVNGDSPDSDQITDSGYDIALALRNEFLLAPGASTTYITRTNFRVSTPEPSSIIGFLTLGTLGAASTLKRKLKS